LAFLAPFAFPRPLITEFATAADTTVIAVCATKRGVDGGALEATAAALRRWPRASVIILTHDRRDDADRVAGAALLETIGHAHAVLMVEPTSAAEARGIVGCADLVISHRLHVAIAAFAEGVPVIGLEYADKMRGIFRDHACEPLLATSACEIEMAADIACGSLGPWKRNIVAQRQHVRELARVNLFGLTACH